MVDILKSLKRRVTLEYLESDGPFLDMGLTPSEVQSFRNKPSPDGRARAKFEKFKAQIKEGDELWYYEWWQHSFFGTGGYAIIRNGEVVDSVRSWIS